MQVATTPAPSAPPAPAVSRVVAEQVTTTTQGGTTIAAPSGASPAEVYRAYKSARSVLEEQRDRIESTIRDLREQLKQDGLNPVDQKGIEQRLTDMNTRLTAMDKAVADADAQVAKAAAVPGATVRPPDPPREGPPDGVFVLGGMFIFAVMLPMAIAYSRRIWRRGASKVPNLPPELNERLNKLDQAVDAVAVELERVGEAQRFMTNVFTEQSSSRALGAGAAERIEIREREKVGVKRDEY